MGQKRIIPPITVYRWPSQVIPEAEIRHILTYLAYKTSKPVTFRWYSEDEGYSENSVSVRVAVSDGSRKIIRTEAIRIGDSRHVPSENQVSVDIETSVPEEKQIFDDDSLALAYIDHNRIIILIELTATDNETARALLAYVVEHSVGLLDFKMSEKLIEQRKRLAQRFCEAFAKGVEKRVAEQEEDLKESQRTADQAYYTILEYERKKPIIQKELKYLKKLQQIRKPRLFRRQAQALIELQTAGQYSSIETDDDGLISATTAPITIEYNNWQFPLGRYTVNINLAGDIKIEALDEHPNTDHPHPHVATDGHPCLGNIAGDVPRMIGSMRIAEALQVLYEFLRQYNPENPYERISHFDLTGQYYDEGDNPCENCDESCNPYCIFECGENNGQYECGDCYEYRTDYCYQECSYNENFERFSPCDDCNDEGTEHCYLDCQYNEQWRLQCPCDNCEFDECNPECPYYRRLQELKEAGKYADSR